MSLCDSVIDRVSSRTVLYHVAMNLLYQPKDRQLATVITVIVPVFGSNVVPVAILAHSCSGFEEDSCSWMVLMCGSNPL